MTNFDDLNKQAWGKSILKHQMLYPNERIVSFLARNFKDIDHNHAKNALDVGFGSGRHLKLLLDYGFNTYGIDYSKESLQIANSVLGHHERLKGLKLESIEENSFFNEFFDVILLFGVVFLRKYDQMFNDLKTMYQLLRPNGKMIVNFRTTEDFLFGKGRKISEETYHLGNSVPVYQNMLYTFLSKEQAEMLLTKVGFTLENIERDDYWKNNLSEKHSWWVFTVRK